MLAANPEINCMVGFYSYNPPRIYEALKAAGKLGQITVIAFDEDPITLGAVREGTIAGTVVQQPFEWGYQGMKLMAKYLEGDKSGIPENKLIIVPTKIIDKANVDAVRGRPEGRDQAADTPGDPTAGAARQSPQPACFRRAFRASLCSQHGRDPSSNSSDISKTYPGVVALDGVSLSVGRAR